METTANENNKAQHAESGSSLHLTLNQEQTLIALAHVKGNEGLPVTRGTFKSLKGKGLVFSVVSFRGTPVAQLTQKGKRLVEGLSI